MILQKDDFSMRILDPKSPSKSPALEEDFFIYN